MRVRVSVHLICLYEYNNWRANKFFLMKIVTGEYYGQWSKHLKFSLLCTALWIILSKVHIVFLCTCRV